MAATASAAVGAPPPRDTGADLWAATDDLGRELPDWRICGPPRPNRTVGIFYFTWLGAHGTALYDISRILATNPVAPAWGPPGAFHWWGEPLLGYYRSDDAWVVRRHAQMLTDAGIDVLILDASNAVTYDRQTDLLAATLAAWERNGGRRAPRFAFLTHARSAEVCRRLYGRLYEPGLHAALWFRWKGRPLILGALEGQHPEVANFFTIRESWAWSQAAWFGNGRDRWPWLDHHPQRFGWHDNPTTPEQISVCVAQHPTANIGRSFHRGRQPPPDAQQPERGLCFAEQWRRAREIDPPFVLVTGWNEWVAQRFVSERGGQPFLGQRLPPGGTYFVDQYNQEFSRDIEPMRGGHGDNYLMQLVAEIRRYKGVRRPPEPSPPLTTPIGGATDAVWSAVQPVFLDDIGDTDHREAPGWGGLRYANRSGRNDLQEARVARDADAVHFHVRAGADLTPPEDDGWMVLWLDADGDGSTGWIGFDARINRTRDRQGRASIERWHSGQWQPAGWAPLHWEGRDLHIAVPRAAVGVSAREGRVRISFKWSDNVPDRGDPLDFLDHGDAAPNGRYRYVYDAAER